MNTKEYMFCTRCGSEEFTPKPDAVLEQEFKGEALKVASPAMACTKCGSLALADGQLDELRRRTADAYRRKHSLLTSAQIKAIREALGKTQREFAAFLRVGEASVKRWETWLVQDASSDELIRVKCVLAKGPAIPSTITVNMHEAKSRLSELVKAVEERGEVVSLCRHGKPVAEIVAAHLPLGDRLTPRPDLKPLFINYDPTEPLSEEEWPSEDR
jgi:putative zinc finger/helix-turn-helix YgiT family protein/prevent-host-death family protein